MQNQPSQKSAKSFAFKLFVSLIMFMVMFALAVMLGAKSVSLADIWSAISNPNATGDDISVIRELRLPREVGGILVGSALAVAGAIMQGLTRNPLADPGLLGLTSGANAALAATFAFMPAVGYFGTMMACFIGAAVGVMLVFGIAALRRQNMSPLRMVLAGSAVSALLAAVADGISLKYKISKNVSMWTSGGLIGTTWGQIEAIAPVIALSLIAAILLSRQLTILSLNEGTAVGLGLKTTRVKIVLYVLITLLAGAAVALVGNLAFIGLMIPHLVRVFAGTDYRTILPLSAVVGGTFMLFADTLSRMINAPFEVSVAAIVSILGLPFFLFIVRKGVRSLS
ncbi:iron ABC transporter permease [Paenibacillus sp. Marseille-P2973]|uniref:FecCD family ABC transporter permease n=1 Tax=Paenibacillus sp. Marseille-P2973 TaxID=1871032 RepID=UPI001B361257|nr:iron ABC transporter permease [Paenibacillus sp. Marseille-P2973]MBQ4902051.1 iron ABC transporter permease [Paenibacillus sp. Marseille-P2973]